MPTSSKNGPRSRGRTGSKFLTSRRKVLEANQICWLCGELIDLTLKWPDPMYGTADHIIPEKELTDPNDPRHWDVKNLKPAHLSCNARRSSTKVKVEHPSSIVWRQ